MELLPTEIHQILFSLLGDDEKDIKECILVCNSWKRIYERPLYSSPAFNSYSRLENFVDTIKRKQHLGKFTRNVRINFENDHKSCKQRSTILKLFSLVPNLEYFNCKGSSYYTLLLKAITANHLPRLNSIDLSFLTMGIDDYVKCCLLLKDRLKTLWILEEYVYEEEEEDSGSSHNDVEQATGTFRFRESFGPGARFFEYLSQFKSLEEVKIHVKSSDAIRLMDYTLDQCPSIRKLVLVSQSVGISIDKFSNKTHDLKELVVWGAGVNNVQVINNAIRNFTKLEGLVISLKYRLDDITYDALFDYLPKLKEAIITNVHWGEQAMLDRIGLFWKANSQKHKLFVKFKDPSRSKKHVTESMKIWMDDEVCLSRIYSTNNEKYRETIEKYGRYIDHVKLSGVDLLSLNSQQSLNLRPGSFDYNQLLELHNNHPLEEFMDHDSQYRLIGNNPLHELLDHCVKVKKLEMKLVNFTSSNFPYRISTTKRDMDYVGLVDCTLQYNDVFEILSNSFPHIKLMDVTKVTYMTGDPERKRIYSDIAMMETDIDTLFISKNTFGGDGSDDKIEHDEENLILVSILSQHVKTYYYYDSKNTNDYKFKPMSVEYFTSYRNLRPQIFLIEVQCKSLGTLIVYHKKKEIRVHINAVQ